MLHEQITKSLCTFTLAAAVSFGATPVARVIGTDAIQVDGITTPARSYTPLRLGNRVATQRGAAVLQFRDGSSISMQPNSVVSLEGGNDAVQVRIVNGTATFTVPSSSRLRVVNGKGETLNRMLDSAVPARVTSSMRERLPVDAAVTYRGSSRLPGGVAPTAAIAVGQFSGGVFRATGGTSAQILTPSGLKLNLTQTTVNGQTVYTVSSITQTVTNPTTGQQVEVTVSAAEAPNNPLFGSVVGGVTNSTPSGTSVSITFTASNGTTIDTSTVTNSVQNAVQTGVNNAIQNNQLPSGTTAPPPSGVQTGTFSGSGN